MPRYEASGGQLVLQGQLDWLSIERPATLFRIAQEPVQAILGLPDFNTSLTFAVIKYLSSAHKMAH